MKKRACVFVCLIFAFASFFGVRALTTRTVSADSSESSPQRTLGSLGVNMVYWDSHNLQERGIEGVAARLATVGYLTLALSGEAEDSSISLSVWLLGAGVDGADLKVNYSEFSYLERDYAYEWYYESFGKYRITVEVEYDDGHYHDEDGGCIKILHQECGSCEYAYDGFCFELACDIQEGAQNVLHVFDYYVICRSSDSPNFGASFVRGNNTFTELRRLEAGRKYEVRARQRDENYYWTGDTATYEKDPDCGFMSLGDGGRYLVLNVPKNLREYTLRFTVNYDFINVSDTGEVLPPVRMSETIELNLVFDSPPKKVSVWEVLLWIAVLGGLAGIMYVVTIMTKKVEGS